MLQEIDFKNLQKEINKVAKIGVFYVDLATEESFWDPILKDIFELAPDFIPYKGASDQFFTNPKELENKYATYRKSFSEGTPFEMVNHILTAKGNRKYIRTFGWPVMRDGHCIALSGKVMDITAQKETERDLIQIKEQWDLAEELVDIGYWQWNVQEDRFQCSDNLRAIYGIGVGTKINLDLILEKVCDDDKELFVSNIEKSIRNKHFETFTYTICTTEKEIRFLRANGKVITDESGQVTEMVGTTQDISEDITRQKELEQKNEQLSVAEELAKVGYVHWNIIRDESYWSDNTYRIYGVQIGEHLTFEKFMSIVHPDDIRPLQEQVEKIIETGNFERIVHRTIPINGTIKTVEILGKAVKGENGETIELKSSIHDITERVARENDLVEKTQLMDFGEQLANIAYWQWNVVRDHITCSDNLYHIHGYPYGTFLNKAAILKSMLPEDRDMVAERLKKYLATGNFEKFTHRILHPNKKITTVQVMGKAFKDKAGKVIKILGVTRDITDQIKKERLLIEKNQQLLSAEKMAKIGNWSWNALTNEVIWSDNLYEIYGHDKNEPVTFEKYVGYIHKEDRDYVTAKIGKAIDTGVYKTLVYRIQLNDGSIKTIKSIGDVTLNEAGRTIEMLGTCQDVTDQILREKELTEKNMQLSFAEEMAGIGYWNWNLENGTVNWSDNLYRIFGFELGIPLKFEDVFAPIHPDDKAHVQKATEEIISSRIFAPMHYRIVLNDGSIRNIELFGKVMTDTKNQVIEVMGTAQDITESTKIQEALVQKNQQLNSAEKMSKIGHWTWNLNSDIAYWSDNLYHIHELPNDTIITLDKFLDCILEEDRNIAKQNIENAIANKKFDDVVYRIVSPKGNIKTLKTVGKVSLNSSGEVIEMIGTCQDISEQIAKENELTSKNQQLSSAEKIAEMGHWTLDPFTKKASWSDNLYEIYGLEKGTPISNENFIGFIHEDDREMAKAKILKIIGTKKFEDLVYRIRLEKGLVKTIRMAGKVITDPKGNIVELLGTCQDISEQIAREQELLEKNQMMAFAEELSGIGYWKWDIMNDVMDKSDNLMRILDFELGTPMNFTRYLSRVHPKDQDSVIEQSQLIEKTKKFEKFTHRIIRLDGSIRTLEITGEVVLDEKGSVTELIGSSNDITDRINDEQELLQQNQLLNLAEELSGIGHWKWNILKSKFEISENFYRILDIDLNESIDYGKFMNSLPLEDREFVTNKLHEILQTKKFEKFSHRIIKKDGSIRSLEVVGDVITDKNGMVELIGTAQDVTERRMAEKKFRGLLESAPDAIIILNKRGKITIANKQAENLLGYAIEELVNKHISFVTPPKFKNLHREYAAKFFNDPNQGYVVKNQELFIKNKAGGQIPVQVSIGPVETADGLLISIAIRDITLRKKAEKRLLQTNRRLKETAKKLSIQNQQLSDFNHITSHNLRSPVSNLNALLKLLQVEKDDVRKSLLFEKFEKVIDHLSSTLDTLVETLRIKSETAQNQTKISFEKVLTKTKDILTAQIMDSGAEIISNFSKASKIEYNEVYLESIFLNLVSNAIKYKSPLRPPVIHIESWVEDGKTKLKVADNGLGIDLKKNGKKLFGLNKVFHRHPEAKGVGLFLTKAQVEAMGGTITAESEVNVGTTFLITLD